MVNPEIKNHPIKNRIRNVAAGVIAAASVIVPPVEAVHTIDHAREAYSVGVETAEDLGFLNTIEVNTEAGTITYADKNGTPHEQPLNEVVKLEEDGRVRYTIPAELTPPELTNRQFENVLSTAEHADDSKRNLALASFAGVAGLGIALAMRKKSAEGYKGYRPTAKLNALFFSIFVLSSVAGGSQYIKEGHELAKVDTKAISEAADSTQTSFKALSMEFQPAQDGSLSLVFKPDAEKLQKFNYDISRLEHTLPDIQESQHNPTNAAGLLLGSTVAGSILSGSTLWRALRNGTTDPLRDGPLHALARAKRQGTA